VNKHPRQQCFHIGPIPKQERFALVDLRTACGRRIRWREEIKRHSSASSVSSQSAQVTERFTINRKALTCAAVHSSQRMTGISVRPSFRAAFNRRCPSNDLAVASNQTGDLKSELADRGTHSIHCGIVLAGISGVEDQPIDGPNLNLRALGRRFLRKHTSPRLVEESFARCARSAGPTN
jgi:hypothetical protein